MELCSLSPVFDGPVLGAKLRRGTRVQSAELLFVASGLASGVGAVTAFVSFDSLLREQHEAAHDSWQKDGRAIGFFWWPKDAAGLARASFRRGILMLRWGCRTPDWAEGRELPDLSSLRIGLAIVLLGVVGMALGRAFTSS